MIPKKGQYYYTYYRGGYAIFKCTSSDENGYSGEKIGEAYGKSEEAKKRVYELNGWSKR